MSNSSAKAIRQYQAQIAAGTGDSRAAYYGDAGTVSHRDVRNVSSGNAADLAATKLQISIVQPKTVDRVRTSVAQSNAISLKGEVLDALVLLATLDDDLKSKAKVLRRRTGESFEAAVKTLKEFDEQFRYTNRVGFMVQRIIDENPKAEISLGYLKDFGVPIVVPSSGQFEAAVLRMKEELIPLAEANELKLKIRKDITRPLFPFGDFNLPELVLDMNEFQHQDVLEMLRNRLLQMQGELEALAKVEEDIQARFTAARRVENVSEMDATSRELLTPMQDSLAVHLKRIAAVGSGDSATGGIIPRLEALMRAAELRDAVNDKQTLKQRVENDITLLETDRVRRIKAHEDAIQRYNTAATDSFFKMQQNVKKQEGVWDRLEACIAELHSLGGDYKALVDEHVEVTEVEQKRRKEFQEYKDCFASHRHTLDQLLENTNIALRTLDAAHSYMCDGRDIIVGRRLEEKLKALLQKERKAYTQSFLKYAEHATMLIHKATVRRTNAERMLHNISFQVDEALRTHDPQLGELQRVKKDAVATVASLTEKLTSLQKAYDAHEEDWCRTEENLEGESDAEEDLAFSDMGGIPLASGTVELPIVQIRALQSEWRRQYCEVLASATNEDTDVALRTKSEAQKVDGDAVTMRAAAALKTKAKKELAEQSAHVNSSTAETHARDEQTSRTSETVGDASPNVSAIQNES